MRSPLSLRAALATLMLALPVAAAAGPWTLAPNEYQAELSGNFSSSATFYDSEGERLPLGGLAERRALVASIETGWRKWASWRFAVPVVSATQRDVANSNVFSNTGLGDLEIGMRIPLRTGASAMALHLDWQGPSGYNRELSPLLASDSDRGAGTGTQQVAASLHLGFAVGQRAFMQMSGGYQYEALVFGSRQTDGDLDDPERDWADHVALGAGLGWWMSDRLLVTGLYRAELPMATGRQVPGSGPDPVDYEVASHLAGARFTYRVDGRLDAFAGSWHSPAGENVLHLDRFYAGLAWKSTRLGRQQGLLGSDRRP